MQGIPRIVEAAKRAAEAQRKAKLYAGRHAARIDRRDPVAAECYEAREVERYMEAHQ